MSIIRINNLNKYFEDQLILREIYFRINPGDRVGLIGKNGVGKTTLLKLILRQEEPTSGTVDTDSDAKFGYFSQFSELNGVLSIQQVLDEVFFDVHVIEEALLEVEIALEEDPEGDALDQLLHRQADLLEKMDLCDGWNYQYKIDTVLSKLGFNQEHRVCPIDHLSGGWKNRAALAKILLEAPDVLLMDEILIWK